MLNRALDHHENLFFTCSVTKNVWQHKLQLCGIMWMDVVSNDLKYLEAETDLDYDCAERHKRIHITELASLVHNPNNFNLQWFIILQEANCLVTSKWFHYLIVV